MDDEELKEKFHELTLMLERIHSDYEMLNIAIRGLEAQMKLLKNELTMPERRDDPAVREIGNTDPTAQRKTGAVISQL